MLKGGSLMSVQDLLMQGNSLRGISRQTGFSRNTIRKYVRNGMTLQAQPRPTRGSKLDAYKPVIDAWMAAGLFNCEVIFQRLRTQGYSGGMTLIKDYVHPFRPPKRQKATPRYETKPGEQAQLDWGICEYIDEHGAHRKIPVFVMILGHSRSTYIEFTRRCDIHSFLRCFTHALEHFGGVPKIALTDRMKTVVLGTNDDRSPIWHPAFQDLALAVGLTPKLCRARRPQTKGKVERAVRYVKENFWVARQFTDLADLNRQALAWCHEIDQRIHGTTGERPCDLLHQEQLRPLPSPEKLAKFLREERKVSMDGYVSFDGVLYGVPWQYSGRTVTVRQLGEQIEVWSEGTRIAVHEKSPRFNGVMRLKGQYAGLSTAQGATGPLPVARQVPVEAVDQRPLSVYAALAEVGA
ncbi:transposase [Alicyclobacillus sacchari]|uniref:Transposase n=1 Tax=Alicyclobacillus sacchari TaxID=392010 RepID=A0A4R8LQC4_9BACL|nr:IS21 family transposase [Alicyclobacillus sacchari]TDY49618.1 transposase [Alicyclobacillus sacchari]GMA58493.1 IS21 family transposase [Alicyclobacillus sacchari]